MGKLLIRPSTLGDLNKIMQLIGHSRQLMRDSGNYRQWTNGYPTADLITDDIKNGHSFVVTDGGVIVGTFAFIIGHDPTYNHIEGGFWDDDTHPYGTIHRMARAQGAHGIFKAAVDWCRSQITSLRIDTHADNATMIHLIERYGFSYRGIIYVSDGTPRLAYQMPNTGILCEPLKKYITETILPQYDNFDEAHRCDHAAAVINNSMHLASHYDVDINMVYAIAAFHDLGLSVSRERHHIVSAQIIRSDNALRQWFSPAQINIMADAAEDHRASSSTPPRTIYGKIVAEADRDIDPLKIVLRTVQYGISHYPSLNKERHWQRTLCHLNEKYGPNGYLKLFLPESPNATHLAELRTLISDTASLRGLFDKYYDSCNNTPKNYI